MDRPRTRFTKAGRVNVAYQVVGDGPVDLVYASGWLHNIDMVWESPRYRAFLEGLAKFSRLILFDKRGTGLSDRDVGAPTLEERAEDIRAVMDAAGSQRAHVFGISEGANMTCMFAATYPERVRSIVVIGSSPCNAWKPDWPHGRRPAEMEAWLAAALEGWGTTAGFEYFSSEMAADPAEADHWRRLLLNAASPSSAEAITRLNHEMDIRPVLPGVGAPALVIVREGDHARLVEGSRRFAELLPTGRLLTLPGEDHLPWFGDSEAIGSAMREFIAGAAAPAAEERVLASVLMTDIVGSTEAAAAAGDSAWREVMEAHDAACRRAAARQEGRVVKSMGDGVLATFAGPSRAIAAAREMRREAAALGLTLRAGVHTGECLRRGEDVSGLAVNIAARIAEAAEDGQLWASSTVRDLVVGSGLAFEPVGRRALKGVPEEWALLRVAEG